MSVEYGAYEYKIPGGETIQAQTKAVALRFGKPIPPPAQLPVQYTEAVRLLAECRTLDDVKQWADKAEALKAWGNIYRRDDAKKEAAKVKLHAYRRMGILAKELAIAKRGALIVDGQSGDFMELKSAGLTPKEADAAICTSEATQSEFDRAIQRSLTPAYFSERRRDAWTNISERLRSAMSQMRTVQAKRVADDLDSGHLLRAQPNVEFILAWLTEFQSAAKSKLTKEDCWAVRRGRGQ